MLFHENRLPADDSHVISYLIFVENWEKCRKNLSSDAVVIGALRVNGFSSTNLLSIVDKVAYYSASQE